jgi:hypothetical protein
VSKLAKYRDAHNSMHWKMLLKVFKYLKGTYKLGLKIQKPADEGPLKLVAYCDADWAEDKDDRKSRTGYSIFLGGNLISWRSKQQTSRAQSTCEAEYYSIFDVIQELKLVSTMLTELKIDYVKPITVFNDNESAINLSNNPMHTPLVKHIDIKYHEIRDNVQSNFIKLQHISTVEMVADTFTKPLPHDQFTYIRDALNLQDTTTENIILPSWSVGVLEQ